MRGPTGISSRKPYRGIAKWLLCDPFTAATRFFFGGLTWNLAWNFLLRMGNAPWGLGYLGWLFSLWGEAGEAGGAGAGGGGRGGDHMVLVRASMVLIT